jgi:hypothetical protein
MCAFHEWWMPAFPLKSMYAACDENTYLAAAVRRAGNSGIEAWNWGQATCLGEIMNWTRSSLKEFHNILPIGT